MLDLTKPIETIHGENVRMLCTNKKGKFPLVTLIGENEVLMSFTIDGRDDPNSTPYLINVPEKRTVWLEEFENGSVMVTYGRPAQEKGTKSIIKVEFTSGQIDE